MVKFVDQTPITRPRSLRWNHAAIVPTLPDHPVACASPFAATSPASSAGDSVSPISIVTPTDSALPTRTFLRGPKRPPSPAARNCPMA